MTLIFVKDRKILPILILISLSLPPDSTIDPVPKISPSKSNRAKESIVIYISHMNLKYFCSLTLHISIQRSKSWSIFIFNQLRRINTIYQLNNIYDLHVSPSLTEMYKALSPSWIFSKLSYV